MASNTSQVFTPFRSLGVVTNDVPFHLFSVKNTDYIALCTDKSLKRTPSKCYTFDAQIWNLQDFAHQGTITFPSDFHPTSIMHPDTYLNKVLIGSREGTMAIYNLRSKKLVYEFTSFGSSIMCMAQSPVVDVVGIGLADGRIIVHNLKLDKTVVTFTQTEGAVTTIAFRTDKQALLATGTPHGQIVLWDLTKRRLLNVFKAHSKGQVVQIAFLHNEPVLISAGADNAVKMWVFDMGDKDTGRLLRARLGHPTPPAVVRWFGPALVITAGDHCLRSQKIMSDGGTREFGVATQAKKLHIDAKLPTIVDFAFNPLKQKEWDDVLTCHENSITAHTWSTERVALGSHAIQSTERIKTPIKAVAISACGNFGFIGTASGWIDKFNMQSGLHRAAVNGPDAHAAAIVGMCCNAANRYLISGSLDGFIKIWNMNLELEHSVELGTPVNKVALSPHSQLLAVSCDDLVIRLYDIDARRVVRKFVGHSNLITDITFSADERWLVSSSTDKTVRIWDIPTGKMIDWFSPKKTVTSLSISPAGDFLATTHSNERSVSVWSNKAYFTGVMLRAVGDVAPSIGLPTIRKAAKDEEVEEKVGDTVIKKENDDDVVRAHSEKRKRHPEASKEEGDGEKDSDSEAEESDTEMGEGAAAHVKKENGTTGSAKQLDSALITLSSVPKARWLTLSDLDQIKLRNKGPEQKVVPDTPFFIPTVQSLQPTFEPETAKSTVATNGTGSRILTQANQEQPRSKFLTMLAAKQYTEALDFLSTLSPSGVDFELHTIPNTEDCSWFVLVLKFLRHELLTNDRFELVQAYMNRFLKIHSTVLMRPEVSKSLEKLLHAHKTSWERIEAIFHSNLCLVNYFSNLHVL